MNNYQKWFLNYVKNYGNIPEITMKRDHSFRVATNTRDIFNLIKLSEDYVSLAHFIGLFHDIGRFEQWRVFKTFYDPDSVDHADYSADKLIKDGKIFEILKTNDYNEIVYDAIKYHNKLFIPDRLSIKNEDVFTNGLSLKEAIKYNYDLVASLYAMAIRDTDKIDILYQYLISDYFLNTDFLPVSKKVATDFYNNKIIDKKDRKNLNDVVVLRLSFINDINLTKTLVFIKNNDFINKIRLIYPDKENVKDFFDYAESRLNYLIDNNLDYQYVLKK